MGRKGERVTGEGRGRGRRRAGGPHLAVPSDGGVKELWKGEGQRERLWPNEEASTLAAAREQGRDERGDGAACRGVGGRRGRRGRRGQEVSKGATGDGVGCGACAEAARR